MYDAQYGEGINAEFGKPHVEFAIRMLKPFFTSPERQHMYRGAVTTESVRRKGYDGLISLTPGHPDTLVIVAFLPGTVRVIETKAKK